MKEKFKILSIDGGGIKGLYSAKILQHFEEKFECHISDYFDMICGTSTGGLIALGLSLKIPAKDLVQFYEEKGSLIFPNRTSNIFLRFYDTFRQTFWGGKFSDIQLRKALEEIFQDKIIGDSNNLLCIPSYSITDARPWIFKFDHGELERDNNTRYVEVALATSAAPTYFPLAEIKNYDNRQFIDGGVWANNPTLVGYTEALTYFVGQDRAYDSIEILSLSSLSITGGEKIGLNRHRSFLKWRKSLFETSMTGQSMFTNYFMNQIKKSTIIPVEYMRIPSPDIPSQQHSLIQLDVATKNAINLIKSKGNDQGLLFKKKPEVAAFFKNQKTYKTK